MRNRPWLWSIVGAAVAAGVVLGVVALTGRGDDSPVAADPTPTLVEPPAESPEPSEAGSEPTPDEESFTVTAYFIGEVPQGPRLFREMREMRGPDAASAAVLAVLAGPVDEDYRTVWSMDPGVTVSGDEDLITVDIDAADPTEVARPVAVTREEAELAIEQVIRTAQEALEAPGAPVRFLVSGEPIAELFGVPTAEPLANRPDDEVLAHIWIDTPEDGATVTPGDEVSGLGNSFEATILWELTRDGELVERGFTTAAQAFGWEPYSFEIPQVPAGTYLLTVSEDDPSGGEGGGPHTDSRTIVVE